MIKAVFLDIDDTIYNTSEFAKLARRAALNAMIDAGLPMSHEDAYKLLREIIKEKGSNYNKHLNVLTKRVFGEEKPLLIAIGMITYHNVKFALLRLFPNTMPTLIDLKSKGYKLGVISNGLTIKQYEKLVRLGLHHFFDFVITSEEAGVEKPDVKIYQLAMERMGCDPENSVMIGNNFRDDILGAIDAGMSAIYLTPGLTEQERKTIKEREIDLDIVSDIGEIRKIL
ncbi:HAD superfamily (subfamily IA) hydrolase, TIGR02253 [Methanobacterium lacus]|jgi:putative hydrolase of the HAD superfamily|uniref:Glyceraldehyde 3-phosphate phosphatase n=1 Tax=Methanobacterium lacus (strain AL-21) TaxID=877455 RepID=F0TCC0_METLA|nr:TIGR02253 family HAD-type hydrolase [Methanobacterium lacus]ADZ10387.1 HAD superfamily (subfamily IA) hydrolase, TIGR02253 [Methanobacterium lacus]